MDWQEQIIRLEERLYKLAEKKKKIVEEEKELLEKFKEIKKKKEEEENRKLADMVQEQLGEMSEQKMEALKNFLIQHAGEIQGNAENFAEKSQENKKERREDHWQGTGHF